MREIPALRQMGLGAVAVAVRPHKVVVILEAVVAVAVAVVAQGTQVIPATRALRELQHLSIVCP